MRILPLAFYVKGLLFTLCLSGCEDTHTSAKHPVAAVVQLPVRYTWATGVTAPGCLPQLQAMMRWYETHTDEFRQATFVYGQPVTGDPDNAPPDPEGPFTVVEGAVDDYLGTLRSSGFFSPRYLATLRARATATARALERHQPPNDQIPSVEDFPLFALNYDDMMERKNTFLFTTERGGRVAIFNDGFTLRRFVFDAACKIDSVFSKDLPQTDENRK